MPSKRFWDKFGSYQNHHNLQEGLFQIASQTCNILVKVNNTNNINVMSDSAGRSDEFGCAGPPGTSRNSAPELRVSLPKRPFRKESTFSGYKQKISTLLESGSVGNASSSDEELEQWEQIFMMREENGNSYADKRKKSIWCRPSCIPVSIVIILIVIVVLVPLLDHANNPVPTVSTAPARTYCTDSCSFKLVETIPEGLIYPSSSKKHYPTNKAWLDLINAAKDTIEIASLYWTLRSSEVYPDPSSYQGEQVFKALYYAGTKRGIDLKIAQSQPTEGYPNIDTEVLLKKKAAQVRSLNFSKWFGEGVLHTKLWLVDRKHFYIGSANMDWRSLTQVKELGAVAFNCSCLAIDLGKIFDVYWQLGEADAQIPAAWPASLHTTINRHTPASVQLDNQTYSVYFSSSPPPLSPAGRSDDAEAILDVIHSAEEFVYVAVMDYFPLLIYSPKLRFWSQIDDAIRTAAIDNRVRVCMLISWWNHSLPSEDYFLRSLTSLTNSYPGVDIQVKRFVVPANSSQSKIPFARVNHNKYMVTDKVAYIGTSNWSGDYFTHTAGVGMLLEDPLHHQLFRNYSDSPPDVRKQLQDVFERDWNSPYAVPLIKL